MINRNTNASTESLTISKHIGLTSSSPKTRRAGSPPHSIVIHVTTPHFPTAPDFIFNTHLNTNLIYFPNNTHQPPK
jgi:hypothetical protein